MANFYLDNSDLKHHLNHPLMKKLVALRERNYSDAEKYDYAPFNFEDAMDSYEKVLEIAGEISGEIVAANAEDVDHEGPHVVDGHVVYAKGTQKNLDALVKAGLMGISIPRCYNGLNFSLVLQHGCRHGKPRLCRIRKHLGIARLRRNHLRICQ